MHIYRFIDESGGVHYGTDYQDGRCNLCEGELFTGLTSTGRTVAVQRLLAPLEPRAILCIGLNYREHAAETGAAIPDEPVLFMKNPAALNHPDAPVVIPPRMVSEPEVDYEVELTAVIGRDARSVSVDEALDCVLGYTVGNDVSARRVQKLFGGGQWVKGKSPDGFCPLGPCIVTPDELGDSQALNLECRVNSQVMQQSNTSDMIFTVAELIAHLSQDMTLKAGTVLLTGTPPGVGVARDPQVFLKPGDVVECEIEKIGTLRNPVQ